MKLKKSVADLKRRERVMEILTDRRTAAETKMNKAQAAYQECLLEYKRACLEWEQEA